MFALLALRTASVSGLISVPSPRSIVILRPLSSMLHPANKLVDRALLVGHQAGEIDLS